MIRNQLVLAVLSCIYTFLAIMRVLYLPLLMNITLLNFSCVPIAYCMGDSFDCFCLDWLATSDHHVWTLLLYLRWSWDSYVQRTRFLPLALGWSAKSVYTSLTIRSGLVVLQPVQRIKRGMLSLLVGCIRRFVVGHRWLGFLYAWAYTATLLINLFICTACQSIKLAYSSVTRILLELLHHS